MKNILTVTVVAPLCVFMLMLSIPATLRAQIPRIISYQGILTDSLGHPKPDSTYAFTFRIYSERSSNNALWVETKSLSTRHGLFATMLGDHTAFPDSVRFDDQYWLSVQVGTEFLIPQLQLGSVGYAFNAIHAEQSDTAKFARNVHATFGSAEISDSVVINVNSINAAVAKPANIVPGLSLRNNTSPGPDQNSPALALSHYSINPTTSKSEENSWYIYNWGFSTSGTSGGVLTFTVKKPSDPLTISPFAIDEVGRTLIGYTRANSSTYQGFWGEDFGQWACILAGKTVVGWPDVGIRSDFHVTGTTTMDGFLSSSRNSGSSVLGDGDSVEVSIEGLTESAGAVATFAEAPATNNPIYTDRIANGRVTFKSAGNTGKRFWYWIIRNRPQEAPRAPHIEYRGSK